MISTELARALRTAGLRWRPVAGDRFMIDRGEFQGDVFTVSEMTIEVHEHPGGRSFGFNGTTEWALDSVDEVDTLWLPTEGQLRELLGASFRSLEIVDTVHAADAGMDPTVRAAPPAGLLTRVTFGGARPSTDESVHDAAAQDTDQTDVTDPAEISAPSNLAAVAEIAPHGRPTSSDADDALDAALDTATSVRFDVVTHSGVGVERYSASTAADAYAEALLSLVLRSVE